MSTINSYYISLDESSFDPLEDSILLASFDQFDDSHTILKKFLFRLVIELHDAGNFSFKTEDYIKKVARAYDIHCNCIITPSFATINLQQTHLLSPITTETYTIRIRNGLNFSKLENLDLLCFSICGRKKLSSDLAVQELQTIIRAPPLYPWYTIPIFYALASFSCAVSFYGGRWIDGGIAFLFGLFVYYVEYLCARVRGLGQIEGFLASAILSLASFSFSRFVLTPLGILHCPYAQIFGGIVWLLPGITLTISSLELYSSMISYGSSRLIYGIAIAAQLGFGLGVGFHLINPQHTLPDDFTAGCPKSDVSIYFDFLMLPLAVVSFCLLCNADIKHLPGMVITACTGFLIAYFTFNNTVAYILAAFASTIVARLYSYFTQQRSLLYIYSGLLVLVPGSMSVKGFINIWSGDTITAIQFTLLMLMNCICLSIGIFLGQIPRKKWMKWRREKMRNAVKTIERSIENAHIREHIQHDINELKKHFSHHNNNHSNHNNHDNDNNNYYYDYDLENNYNPGNNIKHFPDSNSTEIKSGIELIEEQNNHPGLTPKFHKKSFSSSRSLKTRSRDATLTEAIEISNIVQENELEIDRQVSLSSSVTSTPTAQEICNNNNNNNNNSNNDNNIRKNSSHDSNSDKKNPSNHNPLRSEDIFNFEEVNLDIGNDNDDNNDNNNNYTMNNNYNINVNNNVNNNDFEESSNNNSNNNSNQKSLNQMTPPISPNEISPTSNSSNDDDLQRILIPTH